MKKIYPLIIIAAFIYIIAPSVSFAITNTETNQCSPTTPGCPGYYECITDPSCPGYIPPTNNIIPTNTNTETELGTAKATNIPANQTIQATSADGAVANWTNPTVTGGDSGETFNTSCSPSSGSTFAVGTTTVSCSFTDSDNDGDAPTNATFTIAVYKSQQTITFDPIEDTTLGANDIQLSATSTSGLPITFTIASGTCAIQGSLVSFFDPGSCSVTASQSGNGIYLAATSVTNTFFVADGNGIRPSVENAAPNNGDANGDGKLDSLQTNVASAPDFNLDNNGYVSLEVDGDLNSSNITNFQSDSTKGLKITDGSTLPVGGFSFTAHGGFEGSVTVKIILDKIYDTTGWVLKKSDGESGNLVTGPEATFTTVTIGGIPKTEITYSIRDNSVFDQNPTDGVISDPVFPVAPPVPTPAPVSGGGSIVVPSSSYSYGTNNLFSNSSTNIPTSIIGQVLGASTSVYTATCGIYMDPNDAIVPGGKNNSVEQVKLLQKFLNKNLNLQIPVSGFYGKETYEAVRNFQIKYKKEILIPWGIAEPTLNTYYTTVHEINILSCPAVTGPIEDKKLIPLSHFR